MLYAAIAWTLASLCITFIVWLANAMEDSTKVKYMGIGYVVFVWIVCGLLWYAWRTK